MTGNKEGETFANKKEMRPAANAADSPFYRHTGTRSRFGVVVMSMRGPGSASANWPSQIRLLPPRVIPSSGKTSLPWFAGICQAARAFLPRRSKIFFGATSVCQALIFNIISDRTAWLTKLPELHFMCNHSIILITITYKIIAYNTIYHLLLKFFLYHTL